MAAQRVMGQQRTASGVLALRRCGHADSDGAIVGPNFDADTYPGAHVHRYDYPHAYPNWRVTGGAGANAYRDAVSYTHAGTYPNVNADSNA